jgi:hypothetical protein
VRVYPHPSVAVTLIYIYIHIHKYFSQDPISEYPRLCPSLHMKDRAPHPYKIVGKVIVHLCYNLYDFR